MCPPWCIPIGLKIWNGPEIRKKFGCAFGAASFCLPFQIYRRLLGAQLGKMERQWDNDSQNYAYMGAPKGHPYMRNTLKKGPISVPEESGRNFQSPKISKWRIYNLKWCSNHACGVCMQSPVIYRGYCRSMLFISFATTFSKWSQNWNLEGQNLCQAQ